jgi:hypothetical protein
MVIGYHLLGEEYTIHFSFQSIPSFVHYSFILRSSGLFNWQRSETEIWLDNFHLRPDGLGIFSLDTWVNNDILSWHPVNWSGDLVFVASDERVDNAENLCRVATSGSWVGENETNGLLWVDDEDGTDCECLEC